MDSTDVRVTAAVNPPSQPKTAPSYDPEYWEVVKQAAAAAAEVEIPEYTSAHELRVSSDARMKELTRQFDKFADPADPVTETYTEIKTYDGATITLTRFAKAHHRAPGQPLRPAVYHLHGGGMVAGSVPLWAPMIKADVASWDVQVFAVGYRLAPESPAPGPVEDAWAGLRWLSGNAASLGVDPARIVLYGQSAGGGVAAGAALAARDRGLRPPLAKQVLIYPMLDDRTRYGPDWPARPLLTWTEASNAIGWSSYLGDDKWGREDADVSIYAAPGRARKEDLVGLPRTYIDTGGLDLFRDENMRYAAALLEVGTEVEFHLYPGVPHGFEGTITPSVVSRAQANRKAAILAV